MHEFVFIVTYGRSGSTLLQRILNTFPGYCIRGENWNTLFSLFQTYELSLKTLTEKGDSYRSDKDPWYGSNLVDADAFAKRLVDAFVASILQPPEGAKAIGFKEIRYYYTIDKFETYLNFVKTYFKPAKFIFNTRPIEGILQSKWWATMDPEEVTGRIQTLDSLFKSFAEANPECSLLMDYADWAKGPDHLKPLTEFLGVEHNQERITEVMSEKAGY